MKENISRSVRRHHLERLKQNRAQYYGYGLYFVVQESELKRHAGKIANTATLCSCTMCGNPRRQLRRLSLKEVSDLESMFF